MSKICNSKVSNNFRISGHVIPGAPIQSVITAVRNNGDIKNYSYTNEDWITLVSGTNDVANSSKPNHDCRQVLKIVAETLKNQVAAIQLTRLIL